MRFINYGIYAGLGTFFSQMVTGGLSGPRALWPLVIIHLAALVGAGLWAQALEGSPRLSRPFGYFGSVLGAFAATLVVGTLGGNVMELGAVIALAAPWVQCIGRLRCLVQGCCHGRQAAERRGIRCWRERSRVCTIAGLRGVALYPTPVYSMLANVVIGVILLRLWSIGGEYSLIAGAYLILGGLCLRRLDILRHGRGLPRVQPALRQAGAPLTVFRVKTDPGQRERHRDVLGKTLPDTIRTSSFGSISPCRESHTENAFR